MNVAKFQFIIITIRPDDLKRCIENCDKQYSFLKEYVIITNHSCLPAIKRIRAKHKIIVIDEADLLGQNYHNFQKLDHVQKNWLIRSNLVNLQILNDEFIMLDDDNLALFNIKKSDFISRGKYLAYYCHDLKDWLYNDTSYDIAQHDTYKILKKMHIKSRKIFSSHCPQIINKKIFQEAIAAGLKIIKPTDQVDEWSFYFNYGINRYPDLFCPVPYRTMCWPSTPLYWLPKYNHDNYLFENYYDVLYGEDRLFTKNMTSDEKIASMRLNTLIYRRQLFGSYIFHLPAAPRSRWLIFKINHSILIIWKITKQLPLFPDAVDRLRVRYSVFGRFEPFYLIAESRHHYRYDVLIKRPHGSIFLPVFVENYGDNDISILALPQAS